MTARRKSLSLSLDADVRRRLDKAASITKQSPEALLQKAGDEVARLILLNWATDRYREGTRTFGELAQETGLTIEEIMQAMSPQGSEAALQSFLAHWSELAEKHNRPELVQLAREAIARIQTGEQAA